jgi:hypothetical protein
MKFINGSLTMQHTLPLEQSFSGLDGLDSMVVLHEEEMKER